MWFSDSLGLRCYFDGRVMYEGYTILMSGCRRWLDIRVRCGGDTGYLDWAHLAVVRLEWEGRDFDDIGET